MISTLSFYELTNNDDGYYPSYLNQYDEQAIDQYFNTINQSYIKEEVINMVKIKQKEQVHTVFQNISQKYDRLNYY